jgi:hypothetical protein
MDKILGDEVNTSHERIDMYLSQCVQYIAYEILSLSVLFIEGASRQIVENKPILQITTDAIIGGIELDRQLSGFFIKWNIFEFITEKLVIPLLSFRKSVNTVYGEFDNDSKCCIAENALTHLQIQIETRIEKLLSAARILMNEYGRRKLAREDLEFIDRITSLSSPTVHSDPPNEPAM